MSYEQWPYLGVLAVLIAASFGVPIPEDIPLLTGGFLCHRHLASLPVMMVVGVIGVLTGDIVLFGMGRRFGHHIVEHRFMRRLVNPPRLLQAERLFERHGIKIIFAGRFMPGLRPMVFMASGVLKVPFWRFIAVNGLAACISVPILIALGKLFGHNFDRIKGDVRTAMHVIALVTLVAALVGAGVYLHRRQKRMLASAAVNEDIDAEMFAHMPPGGSIPIPEPEPESARGAQSARPKPPPPNTRASSIPAPTTSR